MNCRILKTLSNYRAIIDFAIFSSIDFSVYFRRNSSKRRLNLEAADSEYVSHLGNEI